ncbi:hypothetical protein [Ornithinimicrobium cryptoxanthini]|uniref:Uncharacterized protein n=1 Tax=Ornithinimicrobium cryptoxanthini TaxID=2934161 RepID=A0ABY4YMH7_9MICO|nr:hypothetical protein [Ornithinimicrobium cryptoxanthini]USQ77807.1 hypothetical protein NF557_07910 [Ornithinimicrobium cryptoxanthini]
MTVPAYDLRAWAKGHYPTEAAVELLIRGKGGRFARESQPWIERLGPSSSFYRVDWDRLHDELGVFSGGERRFLNIAVSMGSPDYPVDLSNDLSGLDDELLLLVLAATAHAAGRPRLLSPATAVPAPANPPGSSLKYGTIGATTFPAPKSIRRPEGERSTNGAMPDPREGRRP